MSPDTSRVGRGGLRASRFPLGRREKPVIDRVPLAVALAALAMSVLLISAGRQLVGEELLGSPILIVDRSTGEMRICTVGSCRLAH